MAFLHRMTHSFGHRKDLYSPTLEFDHPLSFAGLITNFFVNIVVNANEVRIF